MANTTRQENSREHPSRSEGESQPRGAVRREEGARQEGSQRGDRERALENGRDVARTASTGTARRQPGLVEGFPPSSTTGGSPFALMSRMMGDMDRLFLDFGFEPAFGISARPGSAGRTSHDRTAIGQPGRARGLTRGTWTPTMEVFTRGHELVARADLPGMKREDINVEILDDHLVIQGERRSDREDRGDGFFHSERSYGAFARAIPLPEGTDGEGIQARFSDGVLEVIVPLPKQEERRRKVEIR